MQLTAEQVRSIRAGKAIRVDDSEIGDTCIVVLAKSVPNLWQDDEAGLPMEVVSRLVDDAMKEYDEDDPLLALYQEMRP